MILAAIFGFAHLKFCLFEKKDTKDRRLTDLFDFSTPKLCKNKRKNNLHSNVEQISMFYISAQAKYTHFRKKVAIFSNLKMEGLKKYICNVQI